MHDHKTIAFAALCEQPMPAILTPSGLEIRSAVRTLEATLATGEHDKILLLLEHMLLQEGALLVVERLLRYASCQHVLLLVNRPITPALLRCWEQAALWEAKVPLAEQFSITTQLSEAAQAQVCLTSIVDIQRQQAAMKNTDAFFTSFDAVLLYDVPANPGMRYHQVIDRFATTTQVIGLSSVLSKEDGETFFGAVIETLPSSISQM